MIVINNIDQGTLEWFALKAGMPSASNFDKIITTKGAPSKQRQGYMYELASQTISPQVIESYTNPAMEEGIKREAESRQLFELVNDVEVEQVAVVYPDEQKKYLCSPDGLIDRREGLELKNPLPKTQVEYLLKGKLPTKYVLQIQGSLLITGFDKWHFQSYSPGLPTLSLKIGREESLISALKSELDRFVFELAGVVKRLREM